MNLLGTDLQVHYYCGQDSALYVLLAGIGLMVWYYARRKSETEDAILLQLSSFERNTNTFTESNCKIFLDCIRLLLVQVIMGVITAHYGVEGQAFYGIPLHKLLPYSISRTWHIQIAIFWIATSWLATGLYYAPAISGIEPKFQKLGVNFLFCALACYCGWFTCRPVDGCYAETWSDSEFLVWTPGL